MSIKTLIQILILLLITLIIGGVYYNYFNDQKNIIEEVDLSKSNNISQINELETKINDLELKNKQLSMKLESSKSELNKTILQNFETETTEENQSDLKRVNNNNIDLKTKNKKSEEEKKVISNNKVIKNLVKDVEYRSVDQRGNKFYLLAKSGKSNVNNNDILDLEDVRGKITSDTRDTIYIVSDYAEYNSVNLSSKFYENVKINYQDKEITSINFDINMETNKAIAYNNVIITDPKSIMKAGIVEFDLKTKNIDINPESFSKEINVITN